MIYSIIVIVEFSKDENDCLQGDTDVKKSVKIVWIHAKETNGAPMRRVDHIVSHGTHYFSCFYYVLYQLEK